MALFQADQRVAKPHAILPSIPCSMGRTRIDPIADNMRMASSCIAMNADIRLVTRESQVFTNPLHDPSHHLPIWRICRCKPDYEVCDRLFDSGVFRGEIVHILGNALPSMFWAKVATTPNAAVCICPQKALIGVAGCWTVQPICVGGLLAIQLCEGAEKVCAVRDTSNHGTTAALNSSVSYSIQRSSLPLYAALQRPHLFCVRCRTTALARGR